VPIDVETPNSPGWWLRRMFYMLGNPKRQQRLARLRAYRLGDPPAPAGAEAAREAYEAFTKKARLNLAELVNSALGDRIQPVGIQTGQDDDETGDEQAGAMWRRAGMDVVSADVHDQVFTYGEAYAIVGPRDELTGAPIVTAEDPRFIVGDPDPGRPRFLRAALKVVYDDVTDEDRAYLYLPGQILVARNTKTQRAANSIQAGTSRAPMLYLDPRTWEWDAERSGAVPHGRMPVVRFCNKDEMGEFEAHIDTLDRINHQILQTMVIGTMQAFRVRAIKNLPAIDPSTNKEIDYSDLLSLDPGSVWQLPDGVDLWESETTDLRPLLEAIKDDLERLASSTKTPLHMLAAGGVNQSAEGAQLQREHLVFKAEDRIARLRPSWNQVASLMLLVMDDPTRADLAGIWTIFAPADRLSLAERADAASKAAADLSLKTRLIKIWQLSPAEAERNLSEKEDELVLQQQLVAATVAGPQPVGAAGAANQQQGGQQQGGQPAGNTNANTGAAGVSATA
jgi:Phage portal protein, SPP1 Gp6-like